MIYFNGETKKVHYNGFDISKIYACDGNLVWSGETPPTPPTPTGYTNQYLTFRIVSGTSNHFSFTNNVDYSLDSGQTWVNLPANSQTQDLNINDVIMWRGNLSALTPSLSSFPYGIGYFSAEDSKIIVEGNIMSLLYGDDFANKTNMKDGQFMHIFYNIGVGILSAENLVLPSTTLTRSCYSHMFLNCSSLTTAPQLPATTLASGCYDGMFQVCSSLQMAPELLATNLADGCYANMFNNCRSITIAPTLSATTLASHCYLGMFSYCTSLQTAPELPATTLADYCYGGMFSYCTSLQTAPELQATTLVEGCYDDMFFGCRNLNSITCLATDISPYFCTYEWVDGVSASGTFTKAASMNDWTIGDSGIPSGWTVVDV